MEATGAQPKNPMTYLDRILDHKRQEVAALQSSARLKEYRARVADLPPPRGFRAALARPGGPHLVAELKKASPSKGLIRPDYDPVSFARRYEACGASAISCLTDSAFFQGSLSDLERVRAAVDLPIIRKDFMLDDAQVYEARAAGADAILLIVAALDVSALQDLAARAAELGLDALVEIHDQAELDKALTMCPTPPLVGINNRNLTTFHTDLAVTEALAPAVPSGTTLVGESGIARRADVERMGAAGVHAVLVGETLMRFPDPGEGVRVLLGLAPEPSRAGSSGESGK